MAEADFVWRGEIGLTRELAFQCEVVRLSAIENGLKHELHAKVLAKGALSVSTEQVKSLVELLHLFDKTEAALPELWIWIAAVVFAYRRKRKLTDGWLNVVSRIGVRENPPNKRAVFEMLTGIQNGLSNAISEVLKLQMWCMDGRQPGNPEYEDELRSVISNLVNQLTEQGVVAPRLKHLPANGDRSSFELSNLGGHLNEIQQAISATKKHVERLDLAPGKPKTPDRALPDLTRGFSVLWELISDVEPNFNNQPNMPSFIQRIEPELEACLAPYTSRGLDYMAGDGEFTVFVKAACKILSGPNLTHGRLRTAYSVLNRSS